MSPPVDFTWVGVRKDLRGVSRLKNAFVSFGSGRRAKHKYFLGNTGSGKTTALQHLIAHLIALGHAFIVFDMRGDLINAILEICADWLHYEYLALFDFRNADNPLGFCPFKGAGDTCFKVQGFLDSIERETRGGLGVQVKETARYAFTLLADAGAPLTRLESIFFDSGYREALLRMSRDASVRGFWKRYGELSKERQLNLAMPVLNKVSLLLSAPSLRKMFGHQAPFDLGKHVNEPYTATLVSGAVDQLHGAGRMAMNLILDSICAELFARVQINESERVPTTIIVDEFEHFNSVQFENLLAEGRRMNCSLVLAHQTLAQLHPRMRSMILNNVGHKLVFRTGREDAATMSKDLTGNPKALDIANLPVGECYFWQQGEKPIHIEVNAPLVKNPGKRSFWAEDYVGWTYSRHSSFCGYDPSNADDPSQEKEPLNHGSLEEWL